MKENIPQSTALSEVGDQSLRSNLQTLLPRSRAIVKAEVQSQYIELRNLQKEWDAYLEGCDRFFDAGIAKAKATLDHLKDQKSQFYNPGLAEKNRVRLLADEWSAEEKRQAAAEAERLNALRRAEAAEKAAKEKREADEKAEAERKERARVAEIDRKAAEAKAEEERKEQAKWAEIERKENEKKLAQQRKDGEITKREADKRQKEIDEQAARDRKSADDEAAEKKKAAAEQAERDKQAADAEAKRKMDEAAKQAADTVANVQDVRVEPSVPKVAGTKDQTYFFSEIQDASQILNAYDAAVATKDMSRHVFLRQFIAVDEKAIGSFARKTKNNQKAAAQIPGVKFFSRG